MLARLLHFRGLLLTLTARELKARYRGSLLGFFWSLVNPLLLLAVYTLVFDVVFKNRAGGAQPYAVFLLSGLFPWIWFSGALLDGTVSLSANAGLLRKAVFPAEVLPVVSTLASLAHYLLALPVLLAALAVARFGLHHPVGGWSILLLPAALLVQLPFTAGLALALAALNVHFKDVRDLLANLLTLMFFLTPILFPLDSIRHLAPVWWAVRLNPFTPYILAYQEALFWGRWPEPTLWVQMGAVSLVAWSFGAGLFERLRETLVEAA